MSGVVLRCPNCGTTRSTAGLCEACHEAEVRCYCSNHTPGLWLDGPACTQCGARLGEPDRAPVAAPRPWPAPVPPTATRPAPRPRFRPAGRPGDGAPRDRRDAGPGAADTPPERRAPRTPPAPHLERGRPVTSLQALLLAALQARRRHRPDIFGAPPGPVPRTRGPGGCLLRLILMMVFFFLALVSGMFLFGGSVMRLVLPY